MMAWIINITFDDVDDGMNNHDMVATEHEIFVESEKEAITEFISIYWEYPQLRFMENHSVKEK